MDKLLQILITLLLAFFITVYRLFVITKIWALVAAPIFLININMLQALGLSLLFNSMSGASEKIEDDKVVHSLVSSLLSITFTWLLAYWIFG